MILDGGDFVWDVQKRPKVINVKRPDPGDGTAFKDVFRFKGGNAGDTIKLSWADNTGKSDSAEATIK